MKQDAFKKIKPKFRFSLTYYSMITFDLDRFYSHFY